MEELAKHWEKLGRQKVRKRTEGRLVEYIGNTCTDG